MPNKNCTEPYLVRYIEEEDGSFNFLSVKSLKEFSSCIGAISICRRFSSLRSRRLEVVDARKNGRARRGHARGLFLPVCNNIFSKPLHHKFSSYKHFGLLSRVNSVKAKNQSMRERCFQGQRGKRFSSYKRLLLKVFFKNALLTSNLLTETLCSIFAKYCNSAKLKA